MLYSIWYIVYDKHKDLTFWFWGPIQEGGFQKFWFVGSSCLCGIFVPYHLRLSVAVAPGRLCLHRRVVYWRH